MAGGDYTRPMPAPNPSVRALSALAALGLATPALTGCGEAPTLAAGGRITVTAREYAERPRAITAAPGRLVVTLRNAGVLDHDLVVRRGEDTVTRLAPVAPGGTGRVTVDLPRGRYELLCTEWRHEQLGEHATLTVR